ncbi:MAG: ATP-binding cassette domain-containing protein [Actinomycetota bacterium]|nr:ATP-binding cassette domain-containing protein [Actinomycetota bacterium]
MTDDAVWVRDATVVRAGRLVWRDVSLTLARGQFAAVLGPNGAGKSTLLQVLLGLLALRDGRAEVLGRPAGAANRRIGYVPQRHGFTESTPIRGIDLVRLGLTGTRWGLPRPWGARHRGDRERVADVLDLVGAGGYAQRPLGLLSGGEQQRLLLAQALVGEPELLLLDEPLESLDLSNQTAIAALLAHISAATGVAVLLVAHDVNPLVAHLQRVIYLASGRAVQGTPEEVINAPTLSALYGAPIDVLRAPSGRLVVAGQPDASHAHRRAS